MAGILTQAAGPVISSSLYNYRAQIRLQDDFMTGGLADGQVGALGWGSGGTITAGTGTAANPGQLGLATGAGSGTVARINMLGGNQMGVPGVFDLTWIFKVGTNDTNTSIRAGISNNWTGDPPTNGIYLEKVYADTNWFVVTRAASTETRTDTGVAVGTAAFLQVQLVGIGTSVLFYINNVLVATHSANIPATGVGPGIHIINNAAANKTMVVDYFEITIEGLTR